MRYLEEKDLFQDDSGEYYIKNEFDPSYPVFINVSSNIWEVCYRGENYFVDWNDFDFSSTLIEDFKTLAKEKLKSNSIKYLVNFKHTLKKVEIYVPRQWSSFKELSIEDLLTIWQNLISHYRGYFREWIIYFAENGMLGVDLKIAREIQTWKAKDESLHLRDVLYWNKEKGALTREEEKIFKEILKDYKNKSPDDMAIHVFAWAMLETVKRTTQVLHIKRDGLKCVGSENKEYFLEMRPVKYQTGDQISWWKISDELAQLIKHFSDIPEIRELQEKYDKLIVWNSRSLTQRGVISSAIAGSKLNYYIKRQKVISPRTGKPLHIKPLRLRHTGATRLAFHGISKDIIQEILEHNSPESAQAYIDAIGSDLIPKLEQSDRNMGSVFSQLENAYFNGNVVDKSEKPPIIVPKVETTPLIVGSCSKNTLKDGGCDRHPFLSCYNGCPHFLAWRESDHYKSLEYVNQEIERWENFLNEGDNRSVLNEYKKVRDSIVEVITIIEEDKE